MRQGPLADANTPVEDRPPQTGGSDQGDRQSDEYQPATQRFDQGSADDRGSDDPDHQRSEPERGLCRGPSQCELQEQRGDVGEAVDGGEVEQAEEQAGRESPVLHQRWADQRIDGITLVDCERDQQRDAGGQDGDR